MENIPNKMEIDLITGLRQLYNIMTIPARDEKSLSVIITLLDHRWLIRSLEAICKNTGLSENEVKEIIDNNPCEIIQADTGYTLRLRQFSLPISLCYVLLIS